MRGFIKSISNELVKFIPEKHKSDPELNENSSEINKRPLVFMVKKMTREHRYNLLGLMDIKQKEDGFVMHNGGTAAKYIWDTCVDEVRNVLLDNEQIESAKGSVKNSLFNTSGMDEEISECLKFIQEISSLNEQEIKN